MSECREPRRAAGVYFRRGCLLRAPSVHRKNGMADKILALFGTMPGGD